MQLLTLVLYGAAAVSALLLVRRDPRHRPIAWYLCAVLLLDVLRLRLHVALPPGPAVRTGWALWLRHLDQALWIGVLLAIPAVAMGLWLRRRPWPVVALGAALWVYVVSTYPDLRGPELLELYTATDLAGALAAGLMMLMQAWRRPFEELTSPAAWCGVLLVSARIAVTVLPALGGEGTLTYWPAIVGVHALVLGAVLALQLQTLIRKEPCHGS